MPRPPRLQAPAAVYHITARGSRRQIVFADDVDYEAWVRRLPSCLVRYGWRCHAYCLLPNHFHLVVTTDRPTIGAGMSWLNSTYAQA